MLAAFSQQPASTDIDLDGDGIDDDLEFAFEDDPLYYRKGDASWDLDAQKLSRRRALRRSFKIQGAVIKFWSLFGVSPEETAPFEMYSEVHRKITSVLIPDLSDYDAEAAAREDWFEDTGGAESITLAQFARGLFGIVDMYTDTCEEHDYVEVRASPRLK